MARGRRRVPLAERRASGIDLLQYRWRGRRRVPFAERRASGVDFLQYRWRGRRRALFAEGAVRLLASYL